MIENKKKTEMTQQESIALNQPSDFLEKGKSLDLMKHIETVKESSVNEWSLAVQNNNIELVRSLIKHHPNKLNAPDESGFTPGALAIYVGHLELANLLKRAGAVCSYITNERGHTLWHRAVLENNLELINRCIDCHVPIHVQDQNGYTAAYYLGKSKRSLIKKVKENISDFQAAVFSDMLNAIYKNDITGFNQLVEMGLLPKGKNEKGFSLLDAAEILEKPNFIEVLEKNGIKRNRLSKDIERNLTPSYEALETYHIEVVNNNNTTQILLTQQDALGKTVSTIKFSPWEEGEKIKTQGQWHFITKGHTCSILHSKDLNASQPDFFCDISSEGEIRLQYANLPNSSFHFSTNHNFAFDSIAALKNLSIHANSVVTGENSRFFNGEKFSVSAKSVILKGTHGFINSDISSENEFYQSGELLSETLKIESGSALITGQMMIPGKANFEIKKQFESQGSVVAGKAIQLKAHNVEIAHNSNMMVQQGELKIYGEAKLENSGSIIGDQVFLTSGLMITNNHGGLIKGLSCILTAPQTNQGGFLLSGQKSSLSYIDWALNFSHAGLKIAELGAYVTPATAISLRGYLLASKALYRAGDIFYRAIQGEEVNASELITLIMDNVIPCLGVVTSQEEQAKILVNILYQFYGTYQSEEAFVEKSLYAIEALSRIARVSSAGVLSDDYLNFLQTAADYIKYSRIGLKTAKITIEAIHGISNEDHAALEKAKIGFGAMAEMAIREYAYTLSPIELYNTKIHLPARDMALFVLNKGYKSDLFLQALLFGALHAAKREGFISADADMQLDMGIRVLLKTKHWNKLYEAYQQGNLSKSNLANEAISSLLLLLSNPTCRSLLNSKPIEPVVQEHTEVLIEVPVEEIVEQTTESIFEPVPEPEKIPLTAEEIEVAKEQAKLDREKIYKDLAQDTPERVIEDITISDINKYFDSVLKRPDGEAAPEGVNGDLLYSSLIEVQKAFSGEYAAHGYLGVFAEAFHNEELIDTHGSVGVYMGSSGTNAGQVRATGGVSLFGQDVLNRNTQGKVISEKLSALSHTQFKHFERGVISAQEAISVFCVGVLENLGSLESLEDINFVASRIVKNHKEGKIISKKEVNILCDLLSDNKGLISGEKVTLEGSKQAALNFGKIISVDKIRLMSEKLVSHESEGELIATRVDFEAPTIHKEGSVNAVITRTLGYEVAEHEKVTWRKNENDSMGALLLKPKITDQIDSDAFSHVGLLDITMPQAFSGEFDFKISPDFSNTVQFHFPKGDALMPIWSLPKLDEKGTLILDAPGHTLEASKLGSEYGSALRFSGQAFLYSGGNTTFHKPVSFATDQIMGLGGKSEVYLKQGGFIQAEKFKNEGFFHSDGIINWNLAEFETSAQLEYFTQSFIHSKHDPKIETHEGARVIENSGTILALGHRGMLGYLSGVGGSLLSGAEGTFAYHTGGNLEAILTQQGYKTSEILEDGGRNWHVMPAWHNAEIGSLGQTVLIGKEKVFAAGLDYYGDKGAHLYAEQGVEKITKEQAYKIDATESRTKKGKFEHYVHREEHGFVQAQNFVSSDEGAITIVATQGDVHLQGAVLSSNKDTVVAAKGKVIIEGTESQLHYTHKERRRHGLMGHTRVNAKTDETKVYSSYVFSNESVTICCDELILTAVKGNILGDLTIMARTATFDGMQQTLNNTTKTKDFSFTLPTMDSLKTIVKGKNAKAIFSNMMQTFGWNQQELDNILHAKSASELPGAALSFAKDTWNMTAFVAHACNELDKAPSEFVGAITDQLGLTVKNGEEGRVLNPRFSFKFTKTTERTGSSKTITSDIFIGGTFTMVGETLNLSDGAKVDAEQLRLFLTEGIKATYGTETLTYSKNEKSIGLGVSALNPQDVDISLSLSKEYEFHESHRLAQLNARDTVAIYAGNKIEGALHIHGEGGGVVSAKEMVFETVQDVDISKSLNVGLHASTMGSSAGASFQKGKQEEHSTKEKAGITLRNGKVMTNHLDLKNGSKVVTDLLLREDGQKGLPTVTGTEAMDSRVNKSKGFSLDVQPNQGLNGKPSGAVNYASQKEETVHRPTVLATNIPEGSLPGINTDADKESEVITQKDKKISLSGAVPDKEEYKKQAAEIKEAGNKALHFIFKTPQSYSSLSVESPAAQSFMAQEQDRLFKEVLSLGTTKEPEVKPKEETKQGKEALTKKTKPNESSGTSSVNKSDWTPIHQKIVGDFSSELNNPLTEVAYKVQETLPDKKQENILSKFVNYLDFELDKMHQALDPKLARERREEIYQIHPELRQYEDYYHNSIVSFNANLPKNTKEMAGDLAFGAAVFSGVGIANPIFKQSKYLYHAYNLHKKGDVNHIFSTVKGQPKHGHLSDTFMNRREIAKTFLKEENFLGKDINGNKWYAEMRSDGTQAWARLSSNGKVKSGGVNKKPLPMHPEYGLTNKVPKVNKALNK